MFQANVTASDESLSSGRPCTCFSDENKAISTAIGGVGILDDLMSLLNLLSSSSLLSFDFVPLYDYHKKWRVMRTSIKGFIIGTGIEGGPSFFTVIARFRRR
ncbi:hypothetical protein Vadar_011864 [Vaccinium darrowii]|uniref:Uncharacterized protein n=1 Tax=Vaccinium darrowii TaxID=229202 RepID=A0ACB7X983_9ERIC|nr:hypothetical protein Vadar_011864 [Vaccinium darrowii]